MNLATEFNYKLQVFLFVKRSVRARPYWYWIICNIKYQFLFGIKDLNWL